MNNVDVANLGLSAASPAAAVLAGLRRFKRPPHPVEDQPEAEPIIDAAMRARLHDEAGILADALGYPEFADIAEENLTLGMELLSARCAKRREVRS